ncbi:MAG: hypothetical protein GX443_09460 [Deltaproteobacteria bacterium]|nr:hypothetical protein [Deltaproteobacteria bacterium]
MNLTARRTRIALFAALPWEFHAFRRRFHPWKLLCRVPFRVSCSFWKDRELLLVETGMGKEMVESAMNWVFWSWPFDFLVSFGFAGGLHPSMSVGDSFLCRDFYRFDTKTMRCDELHYVADIPAELLDWCKSAAVECCRTITTLRHEPKNVFSDALKSIPTAVDMESYYAAAFAHAWKLPFCCFRSISDSCTQELGFQVQDLAGERGRIKIVEVLRTIGKNPRTVPSFFRSWMRSQQAGHSLGKVVSAFVTCRGLTLPDRLQLLVNWPRASSS